MSTVATNVTTMTGDSSSETSVWETSENISAGSAA